MPEDNPAIWTVTTTVGSQADALALARAIVQARLAACVQVEGGLTSVYRWEGRLCEDAEVRLTIKTLHSQLPALQELLRNHHPYSVPQFVATPAQTSAAYGEWVRAELSPASPADGADPTR
jgi:periplasmic divalent cation tolerance protein